MKLLCYASGVDWVMFLLERGCAEEIQPESIEQEKKMRTPIAKGCLYCGLRLPDTADFCPECGRPIEKGCITCAAPESGADCFHTEIEGKDDPVAERPARLGEQGGAGERFQAEHNTFDPGTGQGVHPADRDPAPVLRRRGHGIGRRARQCPSGSLGYTVPAGAT